MGRMHEHTARFLAEASKARGFQASAVGVQGAIAQRVAIRFDTEDSADQFDWGCIVNARNVDVASHRKWGDLTVFVSVRFPETG